jgi:hypothetical protein
MPIALTDNVDRQLRGSSTSFVAVGTTQDTAISGSVSRDAVYSHLRLFTLYCKRINDLITWFTNNKT